MAKRSNDNLYAVCSLSFVERRSYADGKSITEEKGLILIDSGHGGIDPGVVGIGGVKEKISIKN